jgi:probable phosphoglycerate mutase
MTRIYLARHGETDWNLRGRLQGHTDVPLNDSGRAQAKELAARLEHAGVASVTTSDLSRAAETGALVAAVLGIDERSVDDDLRERAFGIFEGLTREECAERHPEDWRAWTSRTSPPKGAESFDGAVERMTRAMVRVRERSGARPALVVSHGGVMRLWLESVMATTLPLIANGSVFLVEHDGVAFVARRWET